MGLLVLKLYTLAPSEVPWRGRRGGEGERGEGRRRRRGYDRISRERGVTMEEGGRGRGGGGGDRIRRRKMMGRGGGKEGQPNPLTLQLLEMSSGVTWPFLLKALKEGWFVATSRFLQRMVRLC